MHYKYSPRRGNSDLATRATVGLRACRLQCRKVVSPASKHTCHRTKSNACLYLTLLPYACALPSFDACLQLRTTTHVVTRITIGLRHHLILPTAATTTVTVTTTGTTRTTAPAAATTTAYAAQERRFACSSSSSSSSSSSCRSSSSSSGRSSKEPSAPNDLAGKLSRRSCVCIATYNWQYQTSLTNLYTGGHISPSNTLPCPKSPKPIYVAQPAATPEANGGLGDSAQQTTARPYQNARRAMLHWSRQPTPATTRQVCTSKALQHTPECTWPNLHNQQLLPWLYMPTLGSPVLPTLQVHPAAYTRHGYAKPANRCTQNCSWPGHTAEGAVVETGCNVQGASQATT